MITKKIEEITVRYRAEIDTDKFRPVYNAAPTQYLPVITNKDKNKIQFFKWGLIPFWAKEKPMGNYLINCRVETMAEKPSFRNLASRKRCLVISDGFYEWKKDRKRKIPYCIKLKNNELFSFAGLWDTWKDKSGENIYSFTIITTRPNELIAPIHDRMPVILTPENEQLWISNELNIKNLLPVLTPYDSDKMTAYTVSTMVNTPENNFKEILEPFNYD